ncbi:hypothetical protein G6F27_014315 [Rhizopus arrhizus]|nr:hypothetical protein G6F27_014315 [Rhizopus arrhizus]
MGILAARRQRRVMQGKADKGVDFINEFITLVLKPLLPALVKNGTKVVTNAGGLDPVGFLPWKPSKKFSHSPPSPL